MRDRPTATGTAAVRARQIVSWLLLASVAAYLLLMAAGPLRLMDPTTRIYIGSIAALAIGLSAVGFVVLYFVTRIRRRG